MAKKDIDIGVEGNDGTGDSIRESFNKVNENFTELYAVFGLEGSISFTDLTDTPETYLSNVGKLPVVNQNSNGIEFREFASNNALDGSADTIEIDYTVEGKIIFKQIVTQVVLDSSPNLGGPLNASSLPIANVDISTNAVSTYNSIFGTDITLEDLVIDKGFADSNYQQRLTVGGAIRLTDEPTVVNQYSLVVDELTTLAGDDGGNLTINGHGLGLDFNGSGWEINTSGTLPTAEDVSGNSINIQQGSVFYSRIRDTDTISLHTTKQAAILGEDKVYLAGGTGTITLTDKDYDSSLAGNWLATEPLPRKSVVRKQGDTMEGILTLADHPGSIAGLGTPEGNDDLQAVTKLYVDKLSPESQINIFVSNAGSDRHPNTPVGSEGKSPAYAYASINAACRKAEEILIASPFETGPYKQTITYGNGLGESTILNEGIVDPIVDRGNATALLIENRKFVQKEVVAFVNTTYPNFEYDIDRCERDVGIIIDSIGLDIQRGNSANYLSRWAAISYYGTVSGQRALGEQKSQTIAAMEYARDLIVGYIITNTAPASTYQTRFVQTINVALTPDAQASAAVANKFVTILDILNNGVFEADPIADGEKFYKINISNGNLNSVDQAVSSNVDIIPGKVIVGKDSGAIGRIINYVTAEESGEIYDHALVDLLEAVEFKFGETLEYANIIKETQVTIKVESGTYYEDFPIRVPQNVSIVGDEFRRCLIRPKNRISQSPNNDIFFYRDNVFDGLVLGNSSIENLKPTIVNGEVSGLRSTAAGSYTVESNNYTTNKLGKDAIFNITVASDGSVTVAIANAGKDFTPGELVTIPDSAIGGSSAPEIIIEIDSVPNGIEYLNPQTNTVDGHFGRHYLHKPELARNIGGGFQNTGDFLKQSKVLIDNKNFIIEQAEYFMLNQYPSSENNYVRSNFITHIGELVDALVADLQLGGLEFSLEAQGNWGYYKDIYGTSLNTEIQAAIGYLKTLSEALIKNTTITIYGTELDYPAPDLFYGDTTPALWTINTEFKRNDFVSFTIDAVLKTFKAIKNHTSGEAFDVAEQGTYWKEVVSPEDTIDNCINLVLHAFNVLHNPALHNRDLDVFLMNDGTILRNITVQNHGGFMAILDPDGQILTRSPYIQTGSCFSQSLNKQAFRGGLFIDAFGGNSALEVVGKSDDNDFELQVRSLPGQGLFNKRPQTPCPFYIQGRRFQVNAVTAYDPAAGTATLILDRNSNDGAGFTGVTSAIDGIDLDSGTDSTPISITLQTAGNRSMLGNDFTQINDLGYGLVCVNGGISEMVSMFTYYCWTSYYAKNGSEIRSLTGSSCYGEYGLVSEGADPNEVPDRMFLFEDLVEPAKTFKADVILLMQSKVAVAAGDVITQPLSNASATVVVGSNSKYIYLKDPVNVFNSTEALELNAVPVGVAIDEIESAGFSNAKESLALYTYDFPAIPGLRSEIDIFHPVLNRYDRYLVTNVEKLATHKVGAFPNAIINTAPVSGSDATFIVSKTTTEYSVELNLGGSGYAQGSTFSILGDELGGTAGNHDATITIDEVDDGESTGPGTITQLSVTGSVSVEDTTPIYDGTIYKLNFSTGGQTGNEGAFSKDGLAEGVDWGQYINYRRNSTFIVDDISSVDTLNIRPSTAVIFDENPGYVYRSISFQESDAVGNKLSNTQTTIGIDTVYDYIRVIIDQTKAQEPIGSVLDLSGVALSNGTTKGHTAGDTTLAVEATADDNEIYRLNNNLRTPAANRPVGTSASTYSEAPIFITQGKKFYIYNYRTIRENESGLDQVVTKNLYTLSGNLYAIVDIEEVLDDSGNAVSNNREYSGSGIPGTLVVPLTTVTLRAGLKAGAKGDVTINISTTRATSHDFLNVGSGGFNTSNYPNVIFGAPRVPLQTKEVDERTKGRVFYVSTDQNGIFRVGRFFSVDQGTGAVTFEASIALSNVDGIGFKRGVVVSEFSSDTSMTDNATDAVPTESAVRGYVDRRLGYDINGILVPNPLGPSVLAANGSIPFSDDQNAANNRITNLGTPRASTDAANRFYVDEAVGEVDTIRGLKNTTFTDVVDSAELVISSGYKMIEVDANNITGTFALGDVFTGSETGGEGTIIDMYNKVRDSDDSTLDKNHLVIVYTPVAGPELSSTGADQDLISVLGGASAIVVEGPNEEFMNTKHAADTDIAVSVNRQTTIIGGVPTARELEMNLQYVVDSIKNADVSASAAISQSKLALNNASLRTDATNISQSDLGVAAFKDTEFTATDGFVELQTATDDLTGVALDKITHIAEEHLLGRADGPVYDADGITVIALADPLGAVSAISFVDVADKGGAILHTDFADSDNGALIRTGGEQYDVTAITQSGSENSLVKTTSTGGIQAQEIIVGLTDTYVILSVDSNSIIFTTPAQGKVFTAQGSTGTVKINVEGTVDLIGDGTPGNDFTESTIKDNSDFSGERSIAATWTYTNFIEAASERNPASAGIALGAGTGYALANEVAIVAGNVDASSSVAPLIVSSSAIYPDVDADTDETGYDIGKSASRYNKIYAREFVGTITGDTQGDVTGGVTGDLFADPDVADNKTKILENGTTTVTTGVVTDSWFLGGLKAADGTDILDNGTDGTDAVLTGTVSDISNHNTNALTEGDANFYYTETRFKTSLDGVTLTAAGGSAPAVTYDESLNTLTVTFSDDGVTKSLSGTGESTSTQTGALIVSGGAGIAKNLNVGGSLEIGADSAEVLKVDKTSGTMEGMAIKPIALPNGDSADNLYNIGELNNKYNTVYATTFHGTALEAYYADLAENYEADAEYEPGTVVVFGGDKEVTVTNRFNDHRIAGVVSTNPAYLMNSHMDVDTTCAVAMTGRVPCKVLGLVEKGDILVASAKPGYAIVNNDAAAGRIIGKALENKETSGNGIIEVVVGKH